MRIAVRVACAALVVTFGGPVDPTGQDMANTLTDAEREAGWMLLFDGTTTDGWRGFKKPSMPDGWQARDGALARVSQAGDIVTAEQFDNFELRLEWKVEQGGNSGIFFHVSEDAEAVWHSGPELQVLDDAYHPDGRSTMTSAGSDYALHGVTRDVTKPVGEWNAVRILVDGSHVEHWMNGEKIVEYELWSPEWGAVGRGQQVRRIPGLRPRAPRPHRYPGSRRPGVLPKYQDPSAAVTRHLRLRRTLT